MKKLLFILLITTSFCYSQEEKRLALVIGNANYEKGALKNPVNDAKLIAKTLDSLGFEVLEYYNLKTQRELKNAIRKFGIKRDSADVGFVYYAGHGVQIKNENYLLPTQESFESELDVEDYAVSVQAILRYLETKTDQVNILVLDACRDNPFKSNWDMSRSLKGDGLAKIPPPMGSLIAFSTDAGKTASDGQGENSIYSRSLSINMLKEGVNIDQVFRNVRSQVYKETKGSQKPVEFTQLTGQEFFLNPGDFEDEINEIEAIIKDDDGDKYTALKIVELILDKEPNNIRATLNKGRIYVQLEEYKQSLIEYNKIIKLDSNYTNAYLYRAVVYGFNLKEYDKALQDYSKAIELAPEDSDYYYYRGQFYQNEKKDYEKAIIDYKMGVTLNPKDGDLYFGLAYSYNELELYQKAIFNYSKALELDPEDTNTHNNIGLIYQNGLNDYKKALESYNKAIEIDSTYARGYLNRADLYGFNLKEYDKAIIDYKKALKINPENSEANFGLIKINFILGNYETCIKLLNKAKIRDVKDPEPDYIISLIHLEGKKNYRALISLSKSIERLKLFLDDGYYISDINNKKLDLSKVFIMRAKLYEKFGENKLMCEDLNDAMNYVKDDVLKKEIQKSILEKCKD